MSTEALLLFMVGITVLAYLFETALSVLNFRHSQAQPWNQEIFTKEQHEKSLSYQRERFIVATAASSFRFVLLLAFLIFGIFGWLDSFLRGYTSNPILLALLFLGAYGLLTTVFSLIFNFYATFSVEERYGFNRTTVGTFIADAIKNILVTVVLGGGILALLVWLHQLLGTNFWIAAWAVIMAVILFIAAFSTSVLVPLFNKLTPLPEGELRSALLAYCQSQGYEIGRLFVMDGSKRSTKANAYFAGMGRAKTIVLFDTLIEKLTIEEVVAVLAHEVGHYKRKHIFSMLYMSLAQTFIIMAMLGFALNFDALSIALGGDTASFHLGAMAFALLLSPLSMLVSMVSMSYSRRNEFDADEFSTSTYAAGQLRSGLAKISTDALSNLNPHPLYVKVHYSHPPMMQRLAALDAAN